MGYPNSEHVKALESAKGQDEAFCHNSSNDLAEERNKIVLRIRVLMTEATSRDKKKRPK